MLNIFSKKLYLKDLLENFVDIHNHILPGIDDGAKNVQESINLIEKLKALGINQFIPTPHVMQDFYPNTDESIGGAYQELLENITPKTLSGITINPAAEYMLDDTFEKLLKTQDLYSLKKNYILVELSYFQPPINLESIISEIKNHGYIPVLAHPERYSFYHNKFDYYKRLKLLGCLFQLNLLSLSNHYGSNVEKTALKLIEEELIDFTGSDVHNEGHILKLSKITISKSTIFNEIKKATENTNNIFSVT